MKIPPPDVNPAIANACKTALSAIHAAKIPFLVGGGLAFTYYTKFPRDFNDLDIFCKAGDYPKILDILAKSGFTTTVQDEKWLAKASIGDTQVDILFSASNGIQVVDDSWFENSQVSELFNEEVRILGPEELLWCKLYVQSTDRFDGPDTYHLILKTGNTIDWKRILLRMEADWEILLAALINFRFIFPSERKRIPKWLMEELSSRLDRQLDMPTPKDRICRGPLLSRTDYEVVIREGEFMV